MFSISVVFVYRKMCHIFMFMFFYLLFICVLFFLGSTVEPEHGKDIEKYQTARGIKRPKQ